MASQSSKSLELLAKYISVLLQKSSNNPEEAELEDTLNQCMIVFKYIEDKDVFQKFYSKMLAKRLVNHISASDDAEASMISKLKQACGFEYTSRLQRMFQYIGVSKDLNENLKRHLTNTGEPLDIDFSIQVLSSGSWPFLPAVLPIQFAYRAGEMRHKVRVTSEDMVTRCAMMCLCYNRFTAFYGGQHSGRKMNWLYHMSKGELVTNCFKNKYTLQVRTSDIAYGLLNVDLHFIRIVKSSNFSGVNVSNVSAACLQ